MASQVRELKWVRGTKFIVDGFRFQDPECRTYFLTHCHSVRAWLYMMLCRMHSACIATSLRAVLLEGGVLHGQYDR